MEDVTALLIKYENYYKRAVKSYETKAYKSAKENYLKAAETMFVIAQKSTKNLKQVRTEKAKKLLLISEQIDEQTGKRTQKSTSENSLKEEKSDLLVSKIPSVSFDDIIGLDQVKKSIYTRMILPLKHPEKYGLYKKKTGGGVLLYGPPGTGKTTIAKAIANEVGASFFLVKGSDIMNKYVGESEKNIAKLFNEARNEELAIIFIDDMDSLFMQRGKDIHNDERVNEFLQQIDGFLGQANNVLMLGATNRPWAIDSAVKRPGRFSEHLYIPLPDPFARREMFLKFLEGVPLAKNIDFQVLVDKTDMYSGADLFELCDQAKIEPLLKYIESEQVQEITQEDFLKAMKTVKPSIDASEIKKFELYNTNKYGN
jgi:transitional endoplasmic reticulum ATPase